MSQTQVIDLQLATSTVMGERASRRVQYRIDAPAAVLRLRTARASGSSPAMATLGSIPVRKRRRRSPSAPFFSKKRSACVHCRSLYTGSQLRIACWVSGIAALIVSH